MALTAPLTSKPAPGHTGIAYDEKSKVVHAYYGSNDLPGHMKHLTDNQNQYPHNKQPFDVLPAGSKENRKKALDGIKTQPDHARDEKPPNFVKHDGKSVTVQSLPKKESSKHVFW